MAKKNCWEVKKCGRESGGLLVNELGVCPSSTNKKLDGIHKGKNAGRACWVIAGTMCEGKIQGTFSEKFKGCGLCDFYNMVKEEEGDNFVPNIVLIEKLK